MPEVMAHAGGNLSDTIVQLIVFFGPVPVIFYFLVRAMLAPDDDEEPPPGRAQPPVVGEDRHDRPGTSEELRSPERAP